jgi:hypothetical protein
LPRRVLPFLIVLIPACIAVALTDLTEGEAGVYALLGKLRQWRLSPQLLTIALLLALVRGLSIRVAALLLGLIPVI